jgi:hypothetical protein
MEDERRPVDKVIILHRRWARVLKLFNRNMIEIAFQTQRGLGVLWGQHLRRSSPMSEPLVVSIPHSLGKEEARRRLQTGLGQAASSLPVLKVEQESWTGDRLTFGVRALGQVASGTIDVEERVVRLQVVLPWMLAKFARAVQSAINARGRLLLEKK